MTDGKLSNKNICSNVSRTEFLEFIRENINFLNSLNHKSKHALLKQHTKPEIEKEQIKR